MTHLNICLMEGNVTMKLLYLEKPCVSCEVHQQLDYKLAAYCLISNKVLRRHFEVIVAEATVNPTGDSK